MIDRVNDVNQSSNADRNLVEAFVEQMEALTYEISRCADALDVLTAKARAEETERRWRQRQERDARVSQDLVSSDEPNF